MNETYRPAPRDTSDVVLPEALVPLVEQMARNVHEVWAQTRMRQGWRYGPERDDAKKTHPCLVPYETLPDEEKLYDRNTAVETLKLILSLGFRIDRKTEASSAAREDRPHTLAESLAAIDRIGQRIVPPKRRALCVWWAVYAALTAGYVLYAALLCARAAHWTCAVPMLLVITLVWGVVTLLVARLMRSHAERGRREMERYDDLMNKLNERRAKLLDREL